MIAALGCGASPPPPSAIAWVSPVHVDVAAGLAEQRASTCPHRAPHEITRTEVITAVALPGGGLAVGGTLSDACDDGFVTRIAGDGALTHWRLGTMIVDLAFADDLLALGWDGALPTFWRVRSDGSAPEASPLPQSGSHAEPERVLPGPTIVGLFSPPALGVLDGWIVRRRNDAWVEDIRHGGGYSAFTDATMSDDGMIAVGFASRSAPYQGWIGVDRSGGWIESAVGSEYEIAYGVAALPGGEILAVGKNPRGGFAWRLDASLELLQSTTWPAPHVQVFDYNRLLVADGTAWMLTRNGRLKHEFTSITILQLPLGDSLGPATDVRTIEGATGGSLARLDDGSIWLAMAITVADTRRSPGTGPIAFTRLSP